MRPEDDPLRLTAYTYYVEYLLCTADQVTDLDASWDTVIASHMTQHAALFCDETTPSHDNTPVDALISKLKRAKCAGEPAC